MHRIFPEQTPSELIDELRKEYVTASRATDEQLFPDAPLFAENALRLNLNFHDKDGWND